MEEEVQDEVNASYHEDFEEAMDQDNFESYKSPPEEEVPVEVPKK